jgi:heat shock protein HslJ
LEFEIKGHDRLRQLDLQGKPIVSSLPYELVSNGTLTPSDLSLSLGGEMTYMADAARFTECQTGRSYPIAQEGDFVKMQRAYQATAKEPGARLYVTFDGSITNRPKMDGEGTERTVVANRSINAWPNERCERAMANPSLTNTYWRIVRVGGDLVSAMQGRREPHLLLRDVGERKGYAATIGCNQLVGVYSIDGEAISFAGSPTTLMACPDPLDALEKKLGETLGKAKRWRITGNTLEFFDETGIAVALFEAVYF